MGAPRGGSCNSNSCMKLSFEGRESQSAIRSHFANARMGSGAASRAFALAGRTMRVDSPAQNKFAKTNSPKRVGKDEERPMDFDLSPKQKEWLDRVQSFMAKHVRPAVPVYDEQDRTGERWKVIPV